jgi:hypothetical protein
MYQKMVFDTLDKIEKMGYNKTNENLMKTRKQNERKD